MTAVEITKDAAKEAARAAAWDEGRECPTCHDGKIPGGRLIVHSFLSGSFGADWELDAVIDLIDGADGVHWQDSWAGHDLAVLTTSEGRSLQYSFDVKRPADAPPAGGAS
jgi:hypothetical protein